MLRNAKHLPYFVWSFKINEILLQFLILSRSENSYAVGNIQKQIILMDTFLKYITCYSIKIFNIFKDCSGLNFYFSLTILATWESKAKKWWETFWHIFQRDGHFSSCYRIIRRKNYAYVNLLPKPLCIH